MLIVDDSKIIRDKIKNALESFVKDEAILEAQSISEAIHIISLKKPDLILIDLSLTDGSGFDIIPEAKKIVPNAILMILTNYPYEQFKRKANELGVNYFFDKSKDFDVVLSIVKEILVNKKSEIKIHKDLEISMQNILVVDDSSIMRKMIMASLKSLENVRFIEAKSGLEAIEQLALTPISIIILDLNMPDIHGMEVLKFIRSHKLYNPLPVIILTTRSDDESKTLALNGGASLYLTKPFNPQTLLDNVKNLLKAKL